MNEKSKVADRRPRLALDAYVLAQGIKTGVYRVCDELFPLLMSSEHLDSRMYILPHDAVQASGLKGRFKARLSAHQDVSPDNADLLLSPFGVPPDDWVLNRHVLHAHVVYDLIAVEHPEYFSAEGAAEVRRIMDGLREDTTIFAISEFTKQDLLAYRPDLRPEQVTVIPLAAGARFRHCADAAQRVAARAKYGIPQDVPYVMSLATLEIRKNLDQVVHAFLMHLNEDPQSDLHLVLSGMSGWKLDHLQKALAVAERWRHRIVLTGFVEDADLSALYSDAVCFVYLSRYEGFGLPPLEAMACGTPVICSDNSSLPEVVGQAGLLFNADDVEGVAGAMHRLLRSPGLRQELAQAGFARARTFSWERCAAIVEQTLLDAHAARRASLGEVPRD
ncbi:glycosyltransferase family 1 protein [Variovorax rhizosphaerae]|uniref:Glycosyltransferase family 1 protein n=1 Tax=Variovorax rhizosphaerae TaxID=1836200 RepID=A0ABU8WI20_9BURK